MDQIQEIEKEEAVQARKELFEQRKQQKSKIAHLAGQVATVSMVSALITSVTRFYFPSLPHTLPFSTMSGMTMTGDSLDTLKLKPSQRYSTFLLSKQHRRANWLPRPLQPLKVRIVCVECGGTVLNVVLLETLYR